MCGIKRFLETLKKLKSKTSLELEVYDRIKEFRALTPSEREDTHMLKIKSKKVIKSEEMKCRQKSHCKWFKEMNKNTKFFHRMANARRNKNHISKIFWQGNHVEDPEEIEQAFVCYFTNLYGFPPNSYRQVEGLYWDC